MADKVKAKEWVASKIGWEHIIPTIGVWKTPDEVTLMLCLISLLLSVTITLV